MKSEFLHLPRNASFKGATAAAERGAVRVKVKNKHAEVQFAAELEVLTKLIHTAVDHNELSFMLYLVIQIAHRRDPKILTPSLKMLLK